MNLKSIATHFIYFGALSLVDETIAAATPSHELENSGAASVKLENPVHFHHVNSGILNTVNGRAQLFYADGFHEIATIVQSTEFREIIETSVMATDVKAGFNNCGIRAEQFGKTLKRAFPSHLVKKVVIHESDPDHFEEEKKLPSSWNSGVLDIGAHFHALAVIRIPETESSGYVMAFDHGVLGGRKLQRSQVYIAPTHEGLMEILKVRYLAADFATMDVDTCWRDGVDAYKSEKREGSLAKLWRRYFTWG